MAVAEIKDKVSTVFHNLNGTVQEIVNVFLDFVVIFREFVQNIWKLQLLWLKVVFVFIDGLLVFSGLFVSIISRILNKGTLAIDKFFDTVLKLAHRVSDTISSRFKDKQHQDQIEDEKSS